MALPPRSFRIVAQPGLMEAAQRFLRAEGFEFEPEPFSDCCFRLSSEPRPLGSSLAAFFGYIYIQDRSSMLPPLALAPEPGGAALDMCASPGSKTGFLSTLVDSDGLVLANEPNPARLATLRANLNVMDCLNVASCQYDGASLPLFPQSWHSILLDPPCSGWGTEKKNPGARKLWQGAKIGKLVKIQRSLLRKAASLLAPGGRLLYSTCTTNPEENERQAEFAIGELGLELEPLAPFAGFAFHDSRLPGTLLVDGEASRAQGFYLAKFRKSENSSSHEQRGEFFKAPPDASCQCAAQALDLSALPKGAMGIYGGKARFLPAQAERILPATLRWQGRKLGEIGASGHFAPNARLKSLLPHTGPVAQIDDVNALRAFLNGAARACGLNATAVGLFWEDLPLGRCQLRKGRLISPFAPLP